MAMKFPSMAVGAVAVAAALAACGGSSSTSSTASSASSSRPPATSTAGTHAATGGAALAADPSGQLKFNKSSLTAKAGTVTIAFTNHAPLGHNLTIQQGTSGAVVGATPTFQGGTKTLTVKLKPGTYTFYCSVPGHRMAGMQGTLTVT